MTTTSRSSIRLLFFLIFMFVGLLLSIRLLDANRKVPDLDLMFDCVEWPVILKKYYYGPNAVARLYSPIYQVYSHRILDLKEVILKECVKGTR
ncbi:hypothetical protein Lser_V15G45629 [Lactuca serriola]